MKAKEFIIVESKRTIRENEQLTKYQIQDKIDRTKKLIAASRSMRNLSIIPNLEKSLKNLEAELKTAPDRVEPAHEIDNTPIPKGYKYDPYREEESDGDNVKIFHYLKLPNGKEVDVDFTPYQEMTGKDISLWIKLGMPKRQGTGPLDSEELEQMARDQGVAESSYTTEKQLLTRIRQIMYDRKLSGTESNAGELHRLKQQLKDMRSQKDVAEGERSEMDTPEFQRALASLKKKAQQGPMKTVYDPRTGKYKVVPVKSKGE
jgi:hypothetical protein